MFKETIQLFENADNCPRVIYGDIHTGLAKDTDIINMPVCSNDFFTKDSGCCKTKDDCHIYTNSATTGLHFLEGTDTTGNKYIDVDNKNLYSNDICYNICYKKLTDSDYNKLQKSLNPNNVTSNLSSKFDEFIKLILISLFVILITALIGACNEFWLRYSYDPCLYYITNYKNLEKINNTNDRISIIDYIFPCYLENYPYQEKKFSSDTSQSGGTAAIRDPDCHSIRITVSKNDPKENGKIFPYWVADIKTNKLLEIIFKCFSFFFLYAVLIFRKILNHLLKHASKNFNESSLKNNFIANNILFLFLMGILFILFGYTFNKFIPNNLAYTVSISALFPLFFILLIINIFTNPIFIFIYGCLALLLPNALTKILTKEQSNETLLKYYVIFSLQNFKDIFYSLPQFESGLSAKNIIYYIFKLMLMLFLNFLIFIMFLIVFCFCIVIGKFMSIAGNLYVNIYTILNFFYIPISNIKELSAIIYNHGDLLSILFCCSIIGSSYFNNFSPITTGIMGGTLFLLILYKSLYNLKKYSKKN